MTDIGKQNIEAKQVYFIVNFMVISQITSFWLTKKGSGDIFGICSFMCNSNF